MAELAEMFIEARKGISQSDKEEERGRGLYSGGYRKENIQVLEKSKVSGDNYSNSTHSNRSNEKYRPWAPKSLICEKNGYLARICPNRKKNTKQTSDKEVIACMVLTNEKKTFNSSNKRIIST